MLLYNSLSNKKEQFVPLGGKNVSLYVCGITPYDTTHLGHAFTYISFDALVRYLTYRGYSVTYTQNVTDINDRDRDILQRAKEQNISWSELANYWTEQFLADMKALNWIMPTNYIKASESLTPMIALIEKLLVKGIAYKINGNVYLDISLIKDYGKLSRFDKKRMIETARTFDEDLDNPRKRNSLDITLWRSAVPGQDSHIPSFDSPFGKGRPGWHIECSAMAISTLGEQIDIHGGGRDLIYPHHESEIAQSEGATGKIPFASYWLHTGSVAYKGRKMSKSEGNLVMVKELLKNYSANTVRWFLLWRHYREDWEFFEKDIEEAQKIISEIETNISKKDSGREDINLWENFNEYLDDDLNTLLALKLIRGSAEEGFSNFARKSLSLLGFTYKT